jgi:molybdopterin-binding protein
VALGAGAAVLSSDRAEGAVMASVHPWEITLAPVTEQAAGSAQNRLEGRVASVVRLGSRVRVGLDCAQPLVAEVTAAAVERLALRPGDRVAASWKATATRLTPR